jgi:membrane-bound lytic murein transglycosylase MltF
MNAVPFIVIAAMHAQLIQRLASAVFLLAMAAPPAVAATRMTENAFLQIADEVRGGDLDEIRRRGFLRVLVVPNKTHFLVDRGREFGVSHDMVREFEKTLNAGAGKRSVRPLQVVFVPVHRDEIFRRLHDRRGDIAVANLTQTPEREALADFSVPFIDNVREIVASGPTAPAISGLEDLAGRTVYLRRSSSFHTHLLQVNDEFAHRGLAPIRLHAADEHLEAEDLLEMLDAGLIHYTVIDQHVGEAWARIFRRVTLHPDVAIASDQKIAWAVRKGTPQLKALVDDHLTRHRSGTVIGNTVLRRYLREGKWVKNATSREELDRFERTISLFRKYATRYAFDPLMLAAQGYQESGLDQRRTSRVGAIGIMQIMPATGRELGVGDIRREESNIHGGAKYMRRLIDQHFEEPGIDDFNRTLFAFASYNAGPGRIAGLRKEAARRGLDPDRWFGHVEAVAQMRIGRETTQYVANIAKYYIAYKLIEGQKKDGLRSEAD